MGLFSPITETSRGFATFVKGVRWLRDHPRQLMLLFVPMALGLVFLATGISIFAAHDETVMSWILFDKPEAWWAIALYHLAYVLLYVAVIVLTFLASLLLMNVIASPIYEYVSVVVERERLGGPEPKLDLLGNLKVMLVELKKVVLILGVSIFLLFIPTVNVISTLISAFLVGWDFFDYPAARRGWSLRQRMRLVGGEFWAVMGLGLWLVIPVVQIFLMPLAVVGGTLLSLEALERQGRLSETNS